MRIAIWNAPLAEFFLSGITTGVVPQVFEVERTDPRSCLNRLQQGKVDLALVPTLTVLRDVEAYSVVPGAALSTWKNPFARLVLRQGIGEPVRSVAFDPLFAQEALVARIVLKEHYGHEPSFLPVADASREALLDNGADAALIVGTDVATLRTDRLVLDLGQEWYELANYPMVWGLFVTTAGLATATMRDLLVGTVMAAEEQRELWTRSLEMPEDLHDFFSNDLRVRFDDLALASLTELRQYLFYYNVLDQMPEIPLATFPEDADEEQDEEEEDFE